MQKFPGRPIFIAAAVYLLIAIVVIIATAAGWWQPYAAEGWEEDPQASMQIVLIALGGIVALSGVAISASRHVLDHADAIRDEARLAADRARLQSEITKEERRREEVADQARADRERELRARYVTITSLLSDSEATTRTAGVYAIGALADDWIAFENHAEAQVCIALLCSYLRKPWSVHEEHSDAAIAERAVREAGFAQITEHLDSGVGPESWQGFRFDLRNALYDFPVTIAELRGTTLILPLPFTFRLKVITIGEGSSLVVRGDEDPRGGALDVGAVEPDGHLQLSYQDDSRTTIESVHARSHVTARGLRGGAHLTIKRIHPHAVVDIEHCTTLVADLIEVQGILTLFNLRDCVVTCDNFSVGRLHMSRSRAGAVVVRNADSTSVEVWGRGREAFSQPRGGIDPLAEGIVISDPDGVRIDLRSIPEAGDLRITVDDDVATVELPAWWRAST